MFQLITGILLIAVFFILFFMLKSGYDKKKELEEGSNHGNKGDKKK